MVTEQERVLAGGGEMGVLLRSRDWSRTSLGPVADWPPALRTAVSVVLGTPHPVCLYWGPDLLALYNDGYRRLLGDRHPAALGAPAAGTFAEDWDRVGPLLGGVLRTQTSASLETSQATFSFTPVRDEHARGVGVLCFASETAARLLDEHRSLHQKVAAAHVRLTNLVENAPTFVCILRGPEHVFERFNPLYEQLVGAGRARIGRPIREALPEAVAQGVLGRLDAVYRTGEPFFGRDFRALVDRHGTGQLEELFITFVYQPWRDARGEVEGIDIFGFEVTERVRARQRAESLTLLLRESEARQRRVLEASGAGLWEVDGSTGRLTADARAAELLGLPPGTGFDLEEGLAHVHPEERELVVLTIARSIQGAHEGQFSLVFRIRAGEGGAERWVESRAQRLLGADVAHVALAGVLLDITERKEIELLRARQARNLAVGARVGVALSRATTVRGMLQECAESLVVQLKAALVRLWLYAPARGVLELEASDGLSTQLDDTHARVPVGQGEIGHIAQERRPHLSSTLQDGARGGDPEWLRREKLVGFAGYPLRVGDRLVGVVALFSYQAVPSDTLDALAQVATSIALGVERLRAEEALRTQVNFARRLVSLWPLRSLEPWHVGGQQAPWDVERLGQVVCTLVTHALASGPEHHPVRISTRVEHGEVSLAISHAGEPLAEGELEDSFELHLVKSFVESQGGTFSVDSTRAEGTRFTVRLPRARP